MAAGQHGVVARRQLIALGLPSSTVHRWELTGHLYAVHRSVYAVGHRQITTNGLWRAAVLACGDDAVLFGRSSAEIWGVLRFDEELENPIHVAIPGRRRHRSTHTREGIIAHQPRNLVPIDLTTRHDIPTTTAARALFDLTPSLAPSELKRALERAQYLEVLDEPRLLQLVACARGHRNIARLRELLGRPHLPLERTNSGNERRFLEICADRDIPVPAVNVPLLGYEVDFLWERQRYVVEVDGGQHLEPEQAARDHLRDATIARAGYLVRRFSDLELGDSRGVADEVLETLAERSRKLNT